MLLGEKAFPVPMKDWGKLSSFVAIHWVKAMESSSHLKPQLFVVYGQFCTTIRVELNLQYSFITIITNMVLTTVT
jgi:hypothetical protein